MTDKEKLEKVKAEIERRKKMNILNENKYEEDIDLLSFIDSMQEEPKYKFKVGDKVMPKRFTDNECGFYIDNSARIVDIVGDYYILEGDKAYKIACQDNWELVKEPTSFDEAIQDGDDMRYNEDLGCRINLSQLKRVAKKEATGELKECIDNITEESLTKARKQLQEESQVCMYSTANYTDEDRKALCDGCEEECKFNKKEEPASDDLEQAIDTYLATYFGGEKEKQDWPFLKKIAIHFANWQKKKNDYAIGIAHMAGEEEGKNIMKQQMMAKAVDGEVGYWNLRGLSINTDLPRSVSEGDKVKIIVINED